MPTSERATPRLADRLTTQAQGRFVGRASELALFQQALQSDQPDFVVLHVHGPGGVGKSTLLREFARLAVGAGRVVVRLDRDVEITTTGMWRALGQALGSDEVDPERVLSRWPARTVLLIDTYERFEPLDAWLREVLLPQLPNDCLVATAGRHKPASAWHTDIAWAGLTRSLALRNLSPAEGASYLAARGIPDKQRSGLVALTHGHPLALSLTADLTRPAERDEIIQLQNEPDLVRVLLERFVAHVPDEPSRTGLQVCAIVRATSEDLLRHVLGPADAARVFDWLSSLSFIERGPQGLCPHDLARDVLDADFRWRSPESYGATLGQTMVYLRDRAARVAVSEKDRAWHDILFANRHAPGLKRFFKWDAVDVAYAATLTDDAVGLIVALVADYEGDESADIVKHWLARQPDAFIVFRHADGRFLGFMAQLDVHRADDTDVTRDPALQAIQPLLGRSPAAQPGDEWLYMRFWMARDTYQKVSPALNLTAVQSLVQWTTRQRLAWNFLAFADPDFYQPHFDSIEMHRQPEADFEVGGRRYGVFAHDWRAEPLADWQARLRARPVGGAPAPSAPQTLVLSQQEFEAAARQALRDYGRPDLLASNPLLRSRLVQEGSAAVGPDAVITLQTLLKAALSNLEHNPQDRKLYAALEATYFDPAPTQELAAERLDLPFNTYRYRLGNGVKRIVAWLWNRETQS